MFFEDTFYSRVHTCNYKSHFMLHLVVIFQIEMMEKYIKDKLKIIGFLFGIFFTLEWSKFAVRVTN